MSDNLPPEAYWEPGWKVKHKPKLPLKLPPTKDVPIGTVIEYEDGRQWRLVDSQRDGAYWNELPPDKRLP